MELRKRVDDRKRFARTILAGVLTVVAITSLLKGKRRSGVLAGIGAVALGYPAATESGGLSESLGVEDEDVELHCAACGRPIRPGERRRPNEDNEVVHEACLESTA